MTRLLCTINSYESEEEDRYELMIYESLLINKYQPKLNFKGSFILLNLF